MQCLFLQLSSGWEIRFDFRACDNLDLELSRRRANGKECVVNSYLTRRILYPTYASTRLLLLLLLLLEGDGNREQFAKQGVPCCCRSYLNGDILSPSPRGLVELNSNPQASQPIQLPPHSVAAVLIYPFLRNYSYCTFSRCWKKCWATRCLWRRSSPSSSGKRHNKERQHSLTEHSR